MNDGTSRFTKARVALVALSLLLCAAPAPTARAGRQELSLARPESV